MAKSKDQLLAQIDDLIVEVNSQYTDLRSASQLQGVDIALLASNIEYLASQVKVLHYFEERQSEPARDVDNATFFTPSSRLDKEVDEQEVYNEIDEEPVVVDEVLVKEEVVETFQVENNYIQEENQPVVETIAVVEEEYIQETVVNVEPVEEEVKTVATPEKPVFVAEEVPSRPLTINELIQQQKQAGVNLTQQFQTSASHDRVVDLKAAISLNDKLLFIKDLFNGYSLAYSEALELLNRFNSYAEADAFLQSNYALKNGWAEKPQTVEKLYAVLRKKFNV